MIKSICIIFFAKQSNEFHKLYIDKKQFSDIISLYKSIIYFDKTKVFYILKQDIKHLFL